MAKRYIFHMLFVFCLICGAAGLKTAALWGLVDLPWATGWIYAAGSVGGLLWLTRAAFVLRRRSAERFDMVVAAEAIIAFGIFSLVLGLVISLNYATAAAIELDALTLATLRPLTIPFLEGLSAAAVAPALATILRQYDALASSEEGEVYGGSPVAGGSGFFKRLEQLDERLSSAVDGAERLALACESGAERVESAVAVLAEATSGLGEEIKAEGERFAAAAASGEGELRSLAQSVAESRTALASLAEETRGLKAAAAEGTTLLNGLARLIDSVERFVKPDRRAS